MRFFLRYKLLRLDHKNVKDDFEIEFLEDCLLDHKVITIDGLHAVSNLIASKGLKQITPISNALKNFYYHLMDEQINIDSVNTEFIDNYINKNCLASGLSFGTRSNYKNSLTAFFNHIDSEFNYDTKFCIGKIKVSSIKTDFNTEEKIDWLDATNIIKVNKEILNYPFNKKQNEFEMHRDILIFKHVNCKFLC